MSNKLVSVVVPVHNAEKYLKLCLDSICKQSYKDLQVIIVDDYSNDNSLHIIKQCEAHDKRIEVVEHNECKGVSAARNSGIEKAKGDYICFVDADDEIEIFFIEQLLETIMTKCVSVVYGGYKYLYDKKISKRKMRLSPGYYDTKVLEPQIIDDGTLTGILFGSACGNIYELKMINTHKIRFPESIKRNEDGIFNIDVINNVKKIYVTEYDGYLYRQWKDEKKYDIYKPDTELDVATNYIKKHYSSFDDFHKQIMYRKASVIFWNAIRIKDCKGGFYTNQKRLKGYLNRSNVKVCYDYLRNEKINKYKRLLSLFLKKRNTFIFTFLMMYIYPLIKNNR